jgi:hypothetical protein
MADDDKETLTTVLVHLKYIRASQERTEEHLSKLNGRTGSLERRVDVLDERNPGKQGGAWGAVAGAVGGFLAGFMK